MASAWVWKLLEKTANIAIGGFGAFLAAGLLFLFVRIVAAGIVLQGWTQVFFALGLIASGALLYGFRCRRPAWYGLVEIIIGMIFAFYTIKLLTKISMPEANGIFSAAGALYIIVRGFDNIYRSLRKGSHFTQAWNKCFFGQDTDAKL